MGLAIRCKHCDAKIQWSYSTLHLIRDLALETCGVNKELCSIIRSCYDPKVDMVRFLMAFHPEIQITAIDFNAMKLAGYYYPNLLFHADDRGDYTIKGKVMSDIDWTHGSIKGLRKELKLLLNESQNIDDQFVKGYARKLYELVDEECEASKNPKIEFH